MFDHEELNTRHKKWLEFLKDYDFKLSYHPSKTNVVTDALSMKSSDIYALMFKDMDLIEHFRDLILVCELTPKSVKLDILKVTNNMLGEIENDQKINLHLLDQLALINHGKEVDFKVSDGEIVIFWDRICVPDISKFKKLILEEGHTSNLNIHRGATKIYQDLKRIFLWPCMQKDVANFVYSFLIC